jgi:hypothetical protein
LACDAYRAMISERLYQRAMGAAAALQELRRCAGTQVDPDVVDAFGLPLPDQAARLSDVAAPPAAVSDPTPRYRHPAAQLSAPAS